MAITPIGPPGGGAAGAFPANIPGGGRAYVSSGICSGTANFFEQDLFCQIDTTQTRSVIDVNTNTGMESCESASGIAFWLRWSTNEWQEHFSTSATPTSGCANAANGRQMHVLAFSSLTQTTPGFGTSANITTSAMGRVSRWVKSGDIPRTSGELIRWGWSPVTASQLHGIRTNNTLAKQWVAGLVFDIQNGGIDYWDLREYPHEWKVTDGDPFFRSGLVYI